MARLKISLVVLLAAAVSIIVLAQTNAQTSTTTVADTTPPVISAVSGTTNIGVTMVTWTTDEPSDSVVEHGSGPSYGSVISNSFLVTNHSVQLNVGFGYDYTYYFRVKSKDASGNVAVSGQQTIFVPLPNVACTDSDNGLTYNQKGTGTGIYAGAVVGYHKIYGQEPHPATPKDTTDQFSTYIDHCATATQLNEGFCSGGKLSAFGYQCPYGCTNGACNAAPAKVACTDSDNGQNLNTKGVAKGFFAGGPVSYSAIYGLEPNPDSAKTTADNFSTYYDYCVNSIQLNESFCDSNGNLAALSFPCSYGCNASAGVCNSPPNDAPPVITAAVKSANTLHPTTIYAGLRAYISITVTDDKGIAFANFNAPGMRYSSADVTLYQCANVKSCSEPVYIIIPDKAGNYTVTVTAKDSAGQTDIKTVAFTAQGCATNSECGGTYFNTGTATTCGPYGASLYTQRMQGQTVAVCSVGTCSEKIQDGVLEDCGVNNKVCGFSPQNGGQFQCVAKPAADCSAGSPITSSCQCGLSSYESYGYCCKDSAGKLYHSTSACPTVSSASVVPGAGAPEPATNEAGVWAQVDVGNGQIAGAAICTRAVCGLNGEYHGYVPPSSWISGSVWWPTAKRYIWQLPGQAGYNSGTFNFNTYVFTVPGGTIYNGQFTATIATSTASSPVVYPAASSVTTPAAPSPAPTVAEPAANPVVFPTTTLPAAVAFPTTTVATTTVPAAPAFVAPSLAVTPPAEAPPAPSEQFFSTRREILRDLRAVERSVKRGEAELDQKQLRTIKAKLLTLPPGTADSAAALQVYREQITDLRQEAGEGETTTLAPRVAARALRQLKQDSRIFERYLAALDAKISQLEKSGLTVDDAIKDTVAAARDIIKQVKAAATYDDIQEIAAEVPEVGQALNDALPRLQSLLNLQRALRLVELRIQQAERAISQSAALAKRLKLDAEEQLEEMRLLLANAKSSLTAIKAEGVTEDLNTLLTETVLKPTNDILTLAGQLQAVGSARAVITRAAAEVKFYAVRMRRLKQAKEEVSAAEDLLAQFQEQLAGLRTAAGQKLTAEVGDQMVEYLRTMSFLRDELESVLRLPSVDPLLAQIKRLFTSPEEKLTPFKVEQLERGVL